MKSLISVLVLLSSLTSLFIAMNCGKQPTQTNRDRSLSGLEITLSKTDYKLYEPILIKFTYVNRSSKATSIGLNFIESYERSVNFFITSDEGKVYDKKIHSAEGLVYEAPQYFIEPGDTFSISMVLNRNNGEPGSGADQYFDKSGCLGNFGYLEPGKYLVYAEDDIGDSTYKTNETAFSVKGLKDDELKILELVRTNNYEEVFKKYPLNVFTEHAMARYCENLPSQNEKGETDTSFINDSFGKFINHYPNSLYDMNAGFVNSYFTKVINKTSDINYVINKMTAKYPASQFAYFINNKAVKNNLIKNYGDLTKKTQ